MELDFGPIGLWPEQGRTMSCPINHAKSGCPAEHHISQDESGLPKERVQSSIPRVDTDSNTSHWLYPSQDMFYNAMKRKGADPNPEEMELVVNIHNIVNEQCWMEVLKWEAMHKYTTCWHPKILIRCLGMTVRCQNFIGFWVGLILCRQRHG